MEVTKSLLDNIKRAKLIDPEGLASRVNNGYDHEDKNSSAINFIKGNYSSDSVGNTTAISDILDVLLEMYPLREDILDIKKQWDNILQSVERDLKLTDEDSNTLYRNLSTLIVILQDTAISAMEAKSPIMIGVDAKRVVDVLNKVREREENPSLTIINSKIGLRLYEVSHCMSSIATSVESLTILMSEIKVLMEMDKATEGFNNASVLDRYINNLISVDISNRNNKPGILNLNLTEMTKSQMFEIDEHIVNQVLDHNTNYLINILENLNLESLTEIYKELTSSRSFLLNRKQNLDILLKNLTFISMDLLESVAKLEKQTEDFEKDGIPELGE